MRFTLAGSLLGALLAASVAEASENALHKLYDRIAEDVHRGEPLRILVFVALCDNEAQGIVKVRNPRICDGAVAERNLYWGGAGGLAGFMRRGGFGKGEALTTQDDAVLQKRRWRRRLPSGGALRARGIRGAIEVEVTGLAYRGDRIRTAMRRFLEAVHDPGVPAHVVAYIGHNYVLDAENPATLHPGLTPRGVERGVLALSCLGHQWIRPLVQRPDARILLLNKQLTFPGAWTLGGAIEALASGVDLRGLHRHATRRFAQARGKPHAVMLRAFAAGDR